MSRKTGGVGGGGGHHSESLKANTLIITFRWSSLDSLQLSFAAAAC